MIETLGWALALAVSFAIGWFARDLDERQHASAARDADLRAAARWTETRARIQRVVSTIDRRDLN